MKKRSRDIHPRNIPTNFEKDPKIGCRVTGVDGRTDRRTDRPTDRPTTRHGNRSSGPKNYTTHPHDMVHVSAVSRKYINAFSSYSANWFSKKKLSTPPPLPMEITKFNVGNSIKREKKKTTFHQYQKLYSTPP